MGNQNHLSVDVEKVRKAATGGVPLSITTYMLPHDMEVYMNEVLTVFLKELGQEHLIDYLVYCLNELATNAKKANTKRVYFKEKGLDINNPEDYAKGMENFKKDTLANITHYLQKQRDERLFIKVIYQARNNKIKLEVRNNSPLTVEEYKRIHDKLCRAQVYTSMDAVLENIVDETEGAGLGLVIMLLMLHKVGLTDDGYQVLVEGDETVVHLELPFSEKTQAEFEELTQELIKLIEELPSFPENIMRINALISSSDSTMASIASAISNDVALTADLLKLVNSAAFRPVNKVQNIEDAVKMVGLQGVKNLLFSLGSMKVLGENTDDTRQMWNHAYRVAFYTYHLARQFYNQNKQVIADAYVCGLLHDIGKIVFVTAHKSVMNQLANVSASKNIPFEVIEKMFSGANHEIIGQKIAEKWNFPSQIVSCIRYHHEPELVEEDDCKTLVELVYLADRLCFLQSGELEFYQISKAILERFKIDSEEKLQEISAKLAENFEKEFAQSKG